MSTWVKGAKAEKLYCDRLIAEGWITRRWQKVRFGPQDLWGTDIIAKRDGKTLYVQVKSEVARMPAVKQSSIKEMQELIRHCGPDDSVLWAGYNIGKGVWKVVVLK